ncbi:N-acetylglucosaminyl-phosphatidylinositol de-N-acetylase [Agrilus planipennis]|uniref:N-acetylglucosaminylphosphatidylinositol deacetylase n=1 Tax=Agrilus planipennis TaxID=224129 RepID=A0A1W4WMF5_AGRPL|nr:N-acetylglucosaminyl-phosphatidylinositol de-N-acetylase [Agrilus planipennis]
MSQIFFWQAVVLRQISNVSVFNKIFVYVRDYSKETVEHIILFTGIYMLLCIILYMGMVRCQKPQFNSAVTWARRVLIVTAHPDDECMFFGPTILNLLKDGNCTVYILCLTTGCNYGMGRIRKTELYRACRTLGINSDNITVKSHSLLPDYLTARWPIEIVEKLVLQEVETYDIDTIITFDKYGVSSHPNHCTIFYGIANLCLEEVLPKDCAIYVLETVNILRKYILIFDIPLSLLFSRTRYFVNSSERSIIHRAMKQHKSQLIWFRWLYIYFSRYMLINTLHKLDLMDIQFELDLEI